MKYIMRSVKVTCFTSAFVLLFLNSNAQAIQQVQNSFNLYKQTALLEKVFVHTDKTVYMPGEIVWFKVYCVDGNDHKPLNLSSVVYIDLLDNSQSPIAQVKVAMKNGFGDGSVYIPVTVTNGNYKLRAYTNWMKNFSPDFYFEKTVTLINPLKSPERAKETVSKYDVQYFPEGGNLVSGIESKVAFKVTGADGKGVPAKGVVINQHNDTVAKFQTLKFGMGAFLFTPDKNDNYKTIIKIADNAPITKELPAINAQGYVIRLTETANGQLDIMVSAGNTTGGPVYLFAHTRQVIKAAETGIVTNGAAHFIINKSVLGDGISHFTIFNGEKQPVCERLYFKNPERQLFINAAADQQQYALRKKVNVNITAKDKDGKSQNAELSMAVYRVDSLQEADQSDIFSYLWLNSDLKGVVESPGYYLKNKDAEAIDNLMLTQGWRRFEWNEVLANKPAGFTFLPEYNGHIISAKIVNSETEAPGKNIITYLGVPGKRVQLYDSQSDSLGRLLYPTKDFFGPGEVIVQTNSLKDSTYRIEVLSPFSEQFSKKALPEFNFNRATAKALQEHSLGVQVLNIYFGNKLKQFYDPMADSAAFYGKPFKTYKLDDFTRFTTMEEDLREYVSEDNIIRQKGHFHIKVLNAKEFLEGDPLVLVDGIPVFNIDKVIAIDPLKVKKLEVVPFRYYYGPASEEGIFSFTTYKGDLGGIELDPKAVVLDYEGLQLRRQFYSPVYDTETQAASRIPDFRNVLYWSPSVAGQGKGTVSFYTSDQNGKYIGVVQGITQKGDAAVYYFTFEVK
ncbi:MAG: MG2 domain-containing protein [Sphingobacteriales bacterium]